MFREILLPSLGKVDDYVAHIQRKYTDLDGNNRNADLDEKLTNAPN